MWCIIFIDKFSCIVHELTHLDDGKYSFPVGKLPFSADFRKMCIEGKAVFHEKQSEHIFHKLEDLDTLLLKFQSY